MYVIYRGRTIGKSAIAQMWDEIFSASDSPYVVLKDYISHGVKYYTVQCDSSVENWIHDQAGKGIDWKEYVDHQWTLEDSVFDLSENLYLMLKLKWG